MCQITLTLAWPLAKHEDLGGPEESQNANEPQRANEHEGSTLPSCSQHHPRGCNQPLGLVGTPLRWVNTRNCLPRKPCNAKRSYGIQWSGTCYRMKGEQNFEIESDSPSDILWNRVRLITGCLVEGPGAGNGRRWGWTGEEHAWVNKGDSIRGDGEVQTAQLSSTLAWRSRLCQHCKLVKSHFHLFCAWTLFSEWVCVNAREI